MLSVLDEDEAKLKSLKNSVHRAASTSKIDDVIASLASQGTKRYPVSNPLSITA